MSSVTRLKLPISVVISSTSVGSSWRNGELLRKFSQHWKCSVTQGMS